jgi:hypothetical protein
MKFLDETRIGVWGWGYGGYVTAMLLGSQQNIFKCGIAVSPIADWLYYSKCRSLFTLRMFFSYYYCDRVTLRICGTTAADVPIVHPSIVVSDFSGTSDHLG